MGVISGRYGLPDCLQASIATAFHLAAFSSARFAFKRTSLFLVCKGTIRAAPNSVTFCTIWSMVLPLGWAWAKVMWQAGGDARR